MTFTGRISVVIDSEDPERLATFWIDAFGYRRAAWSNERYVGLNHDRYNTLILQRVAEPKAAKNRVHLDFYSDDVEVDAASLEAAGASRIAAIEEAGAAWIVMADPDGNEFCVVRAS